MGEKATRVVGYKKLSRSFCGLGRCIELLCREDSRREVTSQISELDRCCVSGGRILTWAYCGDRCLARLGSGASSSYQTVRRNSERPRGENGTSQSFWQQQIKAEDRWACSGERSRRTVDCLLTFTTEDEFFYVVSGTAREPWFRLELSAIETQGRAARALGWDGGVRTRMLPNTTPAARSDARMEEIVWVVERIPGGVDGIVGCRGQPGLEQLAPGQILRAGLLRNSIELRAQPPVCQIGQQLLFRTQPFTSVSGR